MVSQPPAITVPSIDPHLERIRFDATDGSRTNLGQHRSVMRQRGGKRNGFLSSTIAEVWDRNVNECRFVAS